MDCGICQSVLCCDAHGFMYSHGPLLFRGAVHEISGGQCVYGCDTKYTMLCPESHDFIGHGTALQMSMNSELDVPRSYGISSDISIISSIRVLVMK